MIELKYTYYDKIFDKGTKITTFQKIYILSSNNISKSYISVKYTRFFKLPQR